MYLTIADELRCTKQSNPTEKSAFLALALRIDLTWLTHAFAPCHIDVTFDVLFCHCQHGVGVVGSWFLCHYHRLLPARTPYRHSSKDVQRITHSLARSV